jgi:hypothetical protein
MAVDTPMMGCGHAANSEHDGTPACVICFGIREGATTVAAPPDLTGREARCAYCKCVAPSSPSLAFFEHLPGFAFDGYYCGCRGWD